MGRNKKKKNQAAVDDDDAFLDDLLNSEEVKAEIEEARPKDRIQDNLQKIEDQHRRELNEMDPAINSMFKKVLKSKRWDKFDLGAND